MNPSVPNDPHHEVRLHGLNIKASIDDVIRYIGQHVHMTGILLHPTERIPNQWAQLWVANEMEVDICLGFRGFLASHDITMTRPPAVAQIAHPWLSPESSPKSQAMCLPAFPIPVRGVRPDLSSLGYRHLDPHGPLPRNLYIVNIPLDLTQLQFKNLFTSFGMVEHSVLLSQLDGMGRRRGFILMATHREASEALQAMNGRWIEGFKIDVSWALVQREARNFGSNPYNALPNRVIHPPSVPIRREVAPECSVIVDNLNPYYFPNAGIIRDVLGQFGTVLRVTVTQASKTNLQVIIQFEYPVSATALLAANGMSLGGRQIFTRPYDKNTVFRPQIQAPLTPEIKFSPFGQDDTAFTVQDFRPILSGSSASESVSRLNADSQPFVPPFKSTDDPTTTVHSPVNSEKIGSSDTRKSGEEVRVGIDSKIIADKWRCSTAWCE